MLTEAVPNRVQEETDLLVKKWSSDTDCLTGLDDKKVKGVTAVLLENQRLMNEMQEGSERHSKLIPLVREVYPNLLVFKIASCQPLLGPNGLFYHFDSAKQSRQADVITSATRIFDLSLGVDFDVKDRAFDIVNEIDKEVLEDLWSNCLTLESVDTVSLIFEKKHNDRNTIALLRKGMAGAFQSFRYSYEHQMSVNWMVVNKVLYNSYPTAFDSWSNLTVHVNDNCPGILYGHKGDTTDGWDDAGYVYAPYVPFTFTPSVNERVKLTTRYGKKMINARHFGKIIVHDNALRGC